MGHLGGLFILIASITRHHISGHSLPACHGQLEFRCDNGSCIPKQRLCDRHIDCEDGSDEQHCGPLWCEKDEFACHNRRCIASHLFCNGADDCGDGSDEASCQNCTAGFFSCGPSDVCLLRHKLCDGQRDCKDGRDESRELCDSAGPRPQTSSTCSASEFHCGDGHCIRQSWRCDHSPDCTDGSDEENCVQNECLVNNGGCSHHCVEMPMGFLCDCPDDMRLVADSRCEEIDMCLERDVCDQLCVHTNDSLTCECLEGYLTSPSTRECKAKGAEARLVFTSSKEIRELRLSGSVSRELVAQLPAAGPVAVLSSSRTLYTAWPGGASIYRVSLNGKSQDPVAVLKVEGSVSSLAVDWIHRLLYWTGTESGSVNVGLLDGSAQRLLLTGLDRPCAVAVDPLQGLLFWAECGSSPKIERASLDGRDRTALVTSSIRQPVALCLDLPRQLLYWVDRGSRSISRVNLEGRHRKTVVESNGYLDRPFGLAVFEGFVYWSDEVTHSVCRANKHNGGHLQVLLTDVSSPGGVAINQPVLQPDRRAACGRTVTACTHECVVDLTSETPGFTCTPPETKNNTSQGSPAISRTVPTSDLSDAAFAGILSLIILLTAVLVGMTLWWWRKEFRPPGTLTEQSFSLKESQDPLIQDLNTRLIKETA